jgi:hypothetical protein
MSTQSAWKKGDYFLPETLLQGLGPSSLSFEASTGGQPKGEGIQGVSSGYSGCSNVDVSMQPKRAQLSSSSTPPPAPVALVT